MPDATLLDEIRPCAACGTRRLCKPCPRCADPYCLSCEVVHQCETFTRDELERTIAELVDEGLLEYEADEQGEPRYVLTDAGRRRAAALGLGEGRA